MRTTVSLDDDLVREAKHEAVRRGVSFSELVRRALREFLREKQPAALAPFSMVTYGPEGCRQHAPADFHELLEDDDRRSLGREPGSRG